MNLGPFKAIHLGTRAWIVTVRKTVATIGLIGLSLLTFFQQVVQAEPLYCTDLYEFACSKAGPTHDPTGTVDPDISKKVKAALSILKPIYLAKFTRALKEPKNADLLAASHSLFGKRPFHCQQDKKNQFVECKLKLTKTPEDVAEYLYYLSQRTFTSLGEKIPIPFDVFSGLYGIRHHKAYEKLYEEFTNDLRAHLYRDDDQAHIENVILPLAKRLLVQVINNQPISESAKTLMRTKIEAVVYGGGSCPRYFWFDDRIDTELQVNAFTYRETNPPSFVYCQGTMVTGKSDFNMLMITTHELAHLIDPCWLNGPGGGLEWDKIYPMPDLISCLREPRSIQASSRAPGAPSCLRDYDSRHDQISEAVPDWFGTEVATLYIQSLRLSKEETGQAVVNLFRNLCRFDSNGKPLSEIDGWMGHPHTSARMNRIIMVHPVLRDLMDCKSKPEDVGYCDGKNASPR